ncbi:hypothetical protein EPUS_08855 [Endocarpon pusillum Z07020]|uniref:Major facilitator superfamily (MFS) profile domain-containing protein n=1 Tax=Endocarpon pusillum (strain Z07020 / HMAS-L-300199) TaxID=1263415 RepID=U1GL95_ENDPU|nr:uncharacterized protein EPUS_08855 [Endocarpon pusillum Z07020]ERF72998.1 hypothetical protein EPUS_08855 [Endocarpon pusillum Z07020]
MALSTTATSTSREHSLEQADPVRQQEHSTAPSNDSSQKYTHDVKQQPTDQVSTEEEHKWVTGVPLITIMGAICLVCFLMLLDISIIVTAIPQITSDFSSLQDVGWYGSAFQLASAALLPLTGSLYVNFDSKWTFLAFFAVFELGSLLCGVATSSEMLIVGRAVAGMGTSGIQNGAFTIIAECVPMPKRPALIGFVMGVSQLGLVVGPLVGGAFTEYTTWRWCFYINLPIGGLVAAALFFVKVPRPVAKPKALTVFRTLPKKLDLLGFAIFAPAAIQLLLALQYGGNQFAWNSATIIGLFCGAGATFVVFVAWEYYKGDAAMIPLPMLGKRTVWASSLVYGFLMSQMFTTSYYLPIYFQGVKDVSPTLSGVYLLPMILSQLFLAIGAGTLVGKLGYYLPFSLLSGVLLAIGNGLVSTFTPGTSTGRWIGYQILLGAGGGVGLQMPIIAVQNTLPPQQIPIAMALIMFSQTFGGAMFLSFSATIFTNSLNSLIAQYAPLVDPETIIAAGATGFWNVVSGDDLANVLVAYAESVARVFYLTASAGVCCFVFAWGMGWKDIRNKENEASKV